MSFQKAMKPSAKVKLHPLLLESLMTQDLELELLTVAGLAQPMILELLSLMTTNSR